MIEPLDDLPVILLKDPQETYDLIVENRNKINELIAAHKPKERIKRKLRSSYK